MLEDGRYTVNGHSGPARASSSVRSIRSRFLKTTRSGQSQKRPLPGACHRLRTTTREHPEITDSLEASGGKGSAAVLETHVMRRKDQIVAAVLESRSNLFTAGPDELFDRPAQQTG